MNKADKDKVIAALEGALNNAIGHNWQYDIDECNEAITIMRGLAEDAEPQIDYSVIYEFADKSNINYNKLCVMVRAATSPQAAQTDKREPLP